MTYAGVLAAVDPESSWERFLLALNSDIGDVQGGTTKEGIHLGVMAGTLDLLQRGYVGARVRDGVLHIEPQLVARLDGLVMSLQFQGTSIRISISGDELTVLLRAEGFRRPCTSQCAARFAPWVPARAGSSHYPVDAKPAAERPRGEEPPWVKDSHASTARCYRPPTPADPG